MYFIFTTQSNLTTYVKLECKGFNDKDVVFLEIFVENGAKNSTKCTIASREVHLGIIAKTSRDLKISVRGMINAIWYT